MQTIGTVYLSNVLILCNVLYILSFGVNLLSILALLHHTNCRVAFYTDNFVIQDPSSKVIGKGSLVKGLYILQPLASPLSAHSTLSSSFTHVFIVNNVSICKWHHRLGHLSDNVGSVWFNSWEKIF